MSNDIIPSNQNTPRPLSLEVYDRMTDPLAAIKSLGSSIFKSGLFGCDKIEQGEVLAMQCLAERKSPLELARTYHFINGQLAVRADALLAKYQMSGGTVEWIERTDTKVVAQFSKNGNNSVITADIEEYKRNGTAFKSDGKTLKDNWLKWPRRMLTARAISEGVRLIAPEACFGQYVVEELDQTRTVLRTQPVHTHITEIIPADKVDRAVSLLISAGMLVSGQSLKDISDVDNQTILKKPQAFLDAINF
jgi:hypothetical protein